MNRQTKIKLEAIQAHIDRNYKRWFNRYEGLKGVDVGIKIKEGKEVPGCYSIIFHVNKKKKNIRGKVPHQLPVKISSQKMITVPTDVIEAGVLRLAGIQLGDRTRNKQSTDKGTISLYLTNSNGTFACSNMHVMGANLMSQGRLSFDTAKGDFPQPVLFYNETITTTGQLHVGRFGEVDLAFAQVDNPQVPHIIEKAIRFAGPHNGFFTLTYSNMPEVRLFFSGSVSKLKACTPIALNAKKLTAFPNVYLTHLIKLRKATKPGDSGAPLFDERQKITGIIVGHDEDYSYAIPIHKVIEFFQQSKL